MNSFVKSLSMPPALGKSSESQHTHRKRYESGIRIRLKMEEDWDDEGGRGLSKEMREGQTYYMKLLIKKKALGHFNFAIISQYISITGGPN